MIGSFEPKRSGEEDAFVSNTSDLFPRSVASKAEGGEGVEEEDASFDRDGTEDREEDVDANARRDCLLVLTPTVATAGGGGGGSGPTIALVSGTPSSCKGLTSGFSSLLVGG